MQIFVAASQYHAAGHMESATLSPWQTLSVCRFFIATTAVWGRVGRLLRHGNTVLGCCQEAEAAAAAARQALASAAADTGGVLAAAAAERDAAAAEAQVCAPPASMWLTMRHLFVW